MRASRRHTSKTVLDDGPSTSSDSKIKDVDEQKIELVARLLRQIRAVRDRREAQVRRSLRRENSAWPEEKINQYISNKLMGMNSHVEELEKRTTGILLEDILANSKYTNERVWHPTVQPVKSMRALSRVCSPVKALPPIEIKVEENSSLGSVTESHSLLSVNTGETNVEKAAKQEAQVMARIAELRRAGLWTQSRLPLCVEPSRNKTHWDFLLEEVKWMANDFRQERMFKRNMARKIASAIHKQKKEQEMEVEKAEQRRIKEGKRICSTIAKMVRDFWQNVDKVVDFRAQEILESKKRKALDQHLAFIVGEADKLSSLVQEGLVQEKTSKSPSIASKDDYGDREFHLQNDEESDDESTIAREEQALRNHDVVGEINELNREADQDMDDLIASLPPDYLASLGLNIPRPESTLSAVESVNTEPDDASTSDGEEKSSTVDSSRKSEEIKEEDGPSSPKRRRVDEQAEDGKNTKELEEGNGDGRGMLENVDYAKLHSVNSDERQQELANIAEEALKFQPKGFTLETTQVKTVVPFLIRGNLREYQMVGLDWLVTLYEKNLNGILADEMGLGKTIQTISLLAHLACTESNWGPHLIVVPTSVILNWEMEIKKWCPALKILTYFGSVNDRKEKRKGWSKQNSFHVCITSYKTITTDIRSFKMKAWQYLILDEAQNIKNWKSQRWQALLNIRARRRLLLTGTPLQNSLMELWSLMHFLMPAIFASHDDFKDWFSNPLTGMMDGSVEYNAPLVQRLHKVLRPFILRRLKSEVEKQLPEKTEHVIKCQLSKRQRFLYDDFMSRRSTKDNLKSGNMMSVLNIVMQLRKCCNHPNLFEPRPVISPFALSSIRTNFPSIIFDICGEDSHDDKEVPKCLLINDRFQGWNSSVKSKRPTIEELNSYEEPVRPPVVDGFSIQRPCLERKDRLSDDALKAAAMNLGSDNFKKLGLVDGESFIVVRDSEEAVRVQARPEGMNGMVKMKLMGGKVLAETGPVSAGTRMYKLMCSNGETSVHDLGIVSSSGRSDSSESREVFGTAKVKPAVIHPSLRTSTVSINASNTAKESDPSGFHQLMAEGGVRENIVNYSYQFSPPLKRRKVLNSPLVSGDYKECVPSMVSNSLEREKRERLEKARLRFGLLSKPVYSYELLKVLSDECRKIVRNDDNWSWDGWDARNEDIEDVLYNYTNFIIKKFVLYVAPAMSDSPSVKAISSGRTPSALLFQNNVTSISRSLLRDVNQNVHRVMLANSLQFPELRLIEYDCGKLQILANLLRELYLYKHRCLIFTQMSKMLDVLQAFLSYHGYQYFRLDGSTGIEQRQAMMERFNADSKIFCFILSTRSGGVGINLTGADTVIFYDSDWNPTMDAQAQDRCHRIGQTRSVSIYRLISEKTIEENILKKAIQKRRLGELAIDEAGFTPDFFKQTDNIRDLFAGEASVEEISSAIDAPKDQKELDKAMSALEDEQDVAAAKMASAEAKLDTAEFEDKLSTNNVGGSEDTDDKYIELINQLKPIERYAVNFLEAEYKPEFEEEVKEAEAMIEQKKDDWQKAHEKAMHEENNTEDDFYGCGSLLDEILADGQDFFNQVMPSWMPPTPPISDSENDVYYDECLDLLYDPDFMGEARLPSTIYELHRPFTKPPSPVKRSHNTSNLSTEQTVMQLLKSASDQRTPSNYMSSPMPYSEDNDFASADFCNIKTDDAFAGISVPKREKSRGRQDARSQRDLERAVTPPRPNREEYDYEGPEWNIIEDRALLQAVRIENTLKHMLEKNRSALTYNWEFISGFVNRVTGFYRSPRQCCIRYQTAVRPRENGQLVAIDPLTKKPRKVNLTTGEVVHLRKGRVNTDMQYDFDVNSILENRILGKIKTIRALSAKTAKPFRRSLENVSIDALNGRLPLNHENKLNEFNLHRIQAEDIVQIHEEKHFSSELRKKAQEKPVAEERPNPQIRSTIVSVRPPAVTAGAGTAVSKAPFVLEVLALQPIRPTPPPPQSNSATLQQEHNVVTYSQPGIQRRVGAMGNNFSHNMQPQSNQQSGYLVVGHENNVSGIRRQEAGGQGVNQVFRNFTGPPSRRTPPGTPITTGITRAPVGYVTSGGGQAGGGFSTSNQSSSNVYTSCPQPMATGIQRQVQGRVVSRGAGTRMYMTQNGTTIPERGYVVQSNVRMIPNSQRLPQRRTTVTNNSNGQMTTAMVMPNRQNIQQVRAVQRNAAIPPGSRIMVMAPNSRSGSQLVQGHSGAPMTRQLLTRGMNVPSRGGSPQTVAQVVIAPPSSMAQAPQHSSQPPQLTPSNSQSQPGSHVSQSFTPSPQTSQSAPSQQPPSQMQVQQIPAQHGHSSQHQTLQAPNANSSVESGPPPTSGSGPSSHT